MLALRIVLLSLLLIYSACSDSKDKAQDEHIITHQVNVSLELSSEDEMLESIMDKIFVHFVWTPRKGSMQKDGIFPPVEEKRSEIAQLLSEAYRQNTAYSIQTTTLEAFLALVNEWSKISQWGAVSDSGKTYEKLSVLERLDTEIELSLGLLLLDYHRGEPSAFLALLNQQFEAAKSRGELNNIIEKQIQARLLMMYGLQHLDVIHNTHNQHPVSSQTRDIVDSDLQAYRDFLPKEHYALYRRAFELLKIENLRNQVPMDFLAFQITQFPNTLKLSLEELDDMQNHLERFSASYEIFKARDFGSQARDEIIKIAQNPLKNIYDNPKIANYQYGLDYLSLALLNSDVNENLRLSLEYLQKDFKHFQIFEHYFDMPTFHNYISSMFFGAHILSIFKQNGEQFDELVRLISAELAQYKDIINPRDFEFYEDALNMLKQVNMADFAHIELKEIKPKEEEGFIKVPLTLSPIELESVMALQRNKDTSNQQSCLNPQEANFMLSLYAQALKSQGYNGVAPDLFHIRLGEVLGIESLEDEIAQFKLVDFDNFLLLPVADRHCYAKDALDEKLFSVRDRRICGENVYFDRDRGFVFDEISPFNLLEIMPDNVVYFRLKKSDIALNKVLFSNDENALKALQESKDLSPLLAELNAFFPYLSDYLAQRTSQNEALKLLKKSHLKPCL